MMTRREAIAGLGALSATAAVPAVAAATSDPKEVVCTAEEWLNCADAMLAAGVVKKVVLTTPMNLWAFDENVIGGLRYMVRFDAFNPKTSSRPCRLAASSVIDKWVGELLAPGRRAPTTIAAGIQAIFGTQWHGIEFEFRGGFEMFEPASQRFPLAGR
jgi:hypothetical protein